MKNRNVLSGQGFAIDVQLGADYKISGEGGWAVTKKKIVQGKLVRKKESCKSATTKKNASIDQKKILQPQSPPKRNPAQKKTAHPPSRGEI